MSEPVKKLVQLKAPKRDVLSRLGKLEDSFLASLQEIRSVKAEIEKREESPTLEKLLDAKQVAEILGEDERWISRQAKAKKSRRLKSASIGNSHRHSCKSGWRAKAVLDPLLLSCYQPNMSKKTEEVKQMKLTAFRLDPEIHKALKIAAIEAGISMNEALTQAVQTWLKEHRGKGVKK
jgi:HicB-like protein involved in pilus formation